MYLYKDKDDFYLTHNYYELIASLIPFHKHEYIGLAHSGYSAIGHVLRNGGDAEDLISVLDDFYDGYSPIDGTFDCMEDVW